MKRIKFEVFAYLQEMRERSCFVVVKLYETADDEADAVKLILV